MQPSAPLSARRTKPAPSALRTTKFVESSRKTAAFADEPHSPEPEGHHRPKWDRSASSSGADANHGRKGFGRARSMSMSAEELDATLARARNITAETGLMEGQSIPEAMKEVGAFIVQELREIMTPSPDLGREGEGRHRMACEPDNKVQTAKELAAARIQSIFRGKSDREAMAEDPQGSKEAMLAGFRPGLGHVGEGPSTRSKKVNWHPAELKTTINELMNQLNTDTTNQILLECQEAIISHAQEDKDTCLDANKRAIEQAKVTLHVEQWDAGFQRAIKEAELKTADDLHNCAKAGKSLAATGKKALQERDALLVLLEKDSNLVLDDAALDVLEQKRIHVAMLGNRLVEIRNVQDDEKEGGADRDAKIIMRLQEDICGKEGELEILNKWLENIDRQTRMLQTTLDYVDHGQKGPVPEEGVLETIGEAKGRIRESMIAPIVLEYETDHSEMRAHQFILDHATDLEALEEETTQLQERLDKMQNAIKQVPDMKSHEEKANTRLGQICGLFDSYSGILPQSTPPNLTAESVLDLRDSLASQVQTHQQDMKPALKQLDRFEAMMKQAQQSLTTLSSQRADVIDHFKSVKDALVSDTMAVDIGGNVANNQEDRWRQTFQAFHEVEDRLCGGVEEIDARLMFAQSLVDEGLSRATKVRSHCERHGWESKDVLKNCLIDRQRPDQNIMPFIAFEKDRQILVQGAISARHKRWEQDLVQRNAEGQKAAKQSRAVQKAKAAIAAEVMAMEAMAMEVAAIPYSSHGEEAEDDDQDSPSSTRRHSISSDRSVVRFAGDESSPRQKKNLAHIVKNVQKAGKFSPKKGGKAKPLTVKTRKSVFAGGDSAAKKISAALKAGKFKSRSASIDEGVQLNDGEPSSPKSEASEPESPKSPKAEAAVTFAASEPDSPTEEVAPKPILKPKSFVAHVGAEVALPVIPPAAQTVHDIEKLHSICVDLAQKTEEAAETCRGLAGRLGGHPLDPERNHILTGDEADKEKVKKLMVALISGRMAWWKTRQSLSLRGSARIDISDPTEDISREVDAFEQTKANLRLASKNNMEWLQELAARKLQGFCGPRLERIRGDKRRALQLAAITRLQSVIRGSAPRRRLRAEKFAALQVQRILRGQRARKLCIAKASEEKCSAIQVQAFVRGNQARLKVTNMRKARADKMLAAILAMQCNSAVTKIQRLVRARVARMRAASALAERDREHRDKLEKVAPHLAARLDAADCLLNANSSGRNASKRSSVEQKERRQQEEKDAAAAKKEKASSKLRRAAGALKKKTRGDLPTISDERSNAGSCSSFGDSDEEPMSRTASHRVASKRQTTGTVPKRRSSTGAVTSRRPTKGKTDRKKTIVRTQSAGNMEETGGRVVTLPSLPSLQPQDADQRSVSHPACLQPSLQEQRSELRSLAGSKNSAYPDREDFGPSAFPSMDSIDQDHMREDSREDSSNFPRASDSPFGSEASDTEARLSSSAACAASMSEDFPDVGLFLGEAPGNESGLPSAAIPEDLAFGDDTPDHESSPPDGADGPLEDALEPVVEEEEAGPLQDAVDTIVHRASVAGIL